MNNFQNTKKKKTEKVIFEISISQSNYREQFQTAVVNLEQNLMDEKSPILRKMAS